MSVLIRENYLIKIENEKYKLTEIGAKLAWAMIYEDMTGHSWLGGIPSCPRVEMKMV